MSDRKGTRGGYGEWGFEIEPNRVNGVTDLRFGMLVGPYKFPLHQEIVLYRGMRVRNTVWYEDAFLAALDHAIAERWPPEAVWPHYDTLVKLRLAEEERRRELAKKQAEERKKAA